MSSRPPRQKPKHVLAQMAGTHDAEPHVEQRLKTKFVQRGLRGLWMANRSIGIALKEQRAALIAELGGTEEATASAVMLCDVIVRERLLLDAIDGLLLEIGAGVVNRKRKFMYPIVAQRQQIADSLVAHLRTFNELKFNEELERRIEALEDGRVISGNDPV